MATERFSEQIDTEYCELIIMYNVTLTGPNRMNRTKRNFHFIQIVASRTPVSFFSCLYFFYFDFFFLYLLSRFAIIMTQNTEGKKSHFICV